MTNDNQCQVQIRCLVLVDIDMIYIYTMIALLFTSYIYIYILKNVESIIEHGFFYTQVFIGLLAALCQHEWHMRTLMMKYIGV